MKNQLKVLTCLAFVTTILLSMPACEASVPKTGMGSEDPKDIGVTDGEPYKEIVDIKVDDSRDYEDRKCTNVELVGTRATDAQEPEAACAEGAGETGDDSSANADGADGADGADAADAVDAVYEAFEEATNAADEAEDEANDAADEAEDEANDAAEEAEDEANDAAEEAEDEANDAAESVGQRDYHNRVFVAQGELPTLHALLRTDGGRSFDRRSTWATARG